MLKEGSLMAHSNCCTYCSCCVVLISA